MAHQEQRAFFQELSRRFGRLFESAANVLEIGSQNINGSVRDFFPQATGYLGIDLGMAKDVDWIVPGELIELPDSWADIVVSTECFEHCKDWEKVFFNMIRIVKPGGMAIITCASLGRPTHGTIDSDEFSSPFTTSYYKNLGVSDISEEIAVGHYFNAHSFEVDSNSNDLYFWGIRSESRLHANDSYWENPMDRLARAQGQLGQAAVRHAAVQSELEGIKRETQLAKVDAQRAIDEAQQAKDQAKRAKAEAVQANIEKEAALSLLSQISESIFWKVSSPTRRALDIVKGFLYPRR